MIPPEVLTKISDVIWEIPKTYRSDMLVPARIFATQRMLEEVFKDRSLDQLVNVATLHGILGAAMAMPDAHEGYGFPIGGVAAISYPDGIISPGGIGYDINCGVRLLRSQIALNDIKEKLEKLSLNIYQNIPSGVGEGGDLKLSAQEMDSVLRHGASWMQKKGFATEQDLRHIESHGCLENAAPNSVSDSAKKRGLDQLGTLGAGNHFIEIDIVDEIYDEKTATAFGLWKGQAVVLMHTGSRGLGHQVATDHIRIMMSAMPKYGINIPDRELACVPFSSTEGTNYFNAMAAAANFAWANRQYITHKVRHSWNKILGAAGGDLDVVYDVAHNIAKVETHSIDGKKQKVIMHRKGATRSFGPGNPELAKEFQYTGQPVLIPGSMGTASYVLAGTAESSAISFSSCCHGAGRIMSRAAAKRQVHGGQLQQELLSAGIHIQAGSLPGLAEEAPSAYKNVDDVVEVVHQAQIARKVARLKPCVVIKG